MKNVAVLGMLVLIAAQSHAVEPEEPEDGWTVYVEDGKTNPQQVELIPASTPLENYRENLARISPKFDPRFDKVREEARRGRDPAQSQPFAEQFLTVKNLGSWYGYEVFDVSNDKARHRSIILRDKTGNHRILYVQTKFSNVSESPMPYFLEVQGQKLLIYRAPVSGTGHFYVEYYFLFDPESRLPKRLDLRPIENKLAEILPEGHAVWKGGGFDIETLSYSHSVWQEGDGICCPSGGTVSMKLAIRDLALVVVDAEYLPQSIRNEDDR